MEAIARIVAHHTRRLDERVQRELLEHMLFSLAAAAMTLVLVDDEHVAGVHDELTGDSGQHAAVGLLHQAQLAHAVLGLERTQLRLDGERGQVLHVEDETIVRCLSAAAAATLATLRQQLLVNYQ